MYDVKPNLIIGFHGCDEESRNNLLNYPNNVAISRENYDWLGHGIYFWENNYDRALQWAKDKQKRGLIKKPVVIGAVLQLNYCCDFLDSKYVATIQGYHDLMVSAYRAAGKELPKNKDLPKDQYKDKILRELDCAVIEFMNQRILAEAQEEMKKQEYTNIKIFDSTRGVFTEGGPAYNGAGIFEKSHIQICIRNPNCIKGFFLPRKEIDFIKYLQIA